MLKNKMKDLRFLYLLFLIFLFPTQSFARDIINFNQNWVFEKQDINGAQEFHFDDSKWQKVQLPHSYNISDGEIGGAYYRGFAWYRKNFELGPLPSNKRLYIQFDAAFLTADVYINGQKAGRHEGGYAAFRLDITKFVKAGKNNIAVKIDNSLSDYISPLGGDFTMAGGLTRDVSLIYTNDTSMYLLDAASSGIKINTKSVNKDSAILSINALIHSPDLQNLSANISILGADNQVVSSKNVKINNEYLNQDIVIKKPHLWNGTRDPYLYKVKIILLRNDIILDEDIINYGIRTISFDANRGLLLNGEYYDVHGVNLHAFREGKSAAISKLNIIEDLNIIEEMGANAIRLGHYQQSQLVYDEADKRGLIILTEIPINSKAANTSNFINNAKSQIRELILQNYNHVSIITWGIGNEVYSEEDYVAPLLSNLSEYAKSIDNQRPTLYAHCCQNDDHPKAIQTDLTGYNRYFGWYSGEFTDIGKWADSFHVKFPARPLLVTEYGAGASPHQQEQNPRRIITTNQWHPEQYQALYHETNWQELSKRKFVWGKFIWVMFDFPSNSRNEGERAGINDKGLVSADRLIKKDAFYYYKAQWSKIPFVYISSRRDNLRFDATTDIKIYSNQKIVSLEINGHRIGSLHPQNSIAIFKDIILKEGENNIIVRANGQTDEIVWMVSPNGSIFAPNGLDLN